MPEATFKFLNTKLERYISYKAQKKDKAFFKVSAQFTSQECAACGHIHPDNRKQQKSFVCIECGHSDNADWISM